MYTCSTSVSKRESVEPLRSEPAVRSAAILGWLWNSGPLTWYLIFRLLVWRSTLNLDDGENAKRGSGVEVVNKSGRVDRMENANSRKRGSSCRNIERDRAGSSAAGPRLFVVVRKPPGPNDAVKTDPPNGLGAKPPPPRSPPKNMLNSSSGLTSPPKLVYMAGENPGDLLEDMPLNLDSGSEPCWSYAARF